MGGEREKETNRGLDGHRKTEAEVYKHTESEKETDSCRETDRGLDRERWKHKPFNMFAFQLIVMLNVLGQINLQYNTTQRQRQRTIEIQRGRKSRRHPGRQTDS